MKKGSLPRNRLIIASIILILIATLSPSGGVKVDIPFVDKVVHFFLFFALAANISYKYQNGTKEAPMLMWAILFGLLTEVLQQFVPGRDMDLYDGIADTLGVIGGYFFYMNMPTLCDNWIKKLGG